MVGEGGFLGRARRTIKGVHERVAGNGSAGTAGSSCEGVVESRLVTAHKVLDSLVGREVNRMCGT